MAEEKMIDLGKALAKQSSPLRLRLVFTCVIISILSSNAYSQSDSSGSSFFPLEVGNIWRYQEGPDSSSYYQTKLTRDSAFGTTHYLFYDNSNKPTYKVDSALNVTFSPFVPASAWTKYRLAAKKGDVWTAFIGPYGGRVAARLDSVYWDIVAGSYTEVKGIGYYTQGADTTNFSVWLYSDYLAAGYGFYMNIADAEQSPNDFLVGAFIDGIAYGNVTGVSSQPNNRITLGYKLYPAYPNPFNPSTTISFDLPSRSYVTLKMFDILGREVSTIVSEELQAGNYARQWNAANMDSGVFFYRLQAGTYTETRKLLLLK
jgi:hypothetical protein